MMPTPKPITIDTLFADLMRNRVRMDPGTQWIEELPASNGRQVLTAVKTKPMVLYREAADMIRHSLGDEPRLPLKRVILCVGKCRVGSTALCQIMGMAKIHSFYQPIKAMIRWLLLGKQCNQWDGVCSAASEAVFVKETVGPFTLCECLLNPVEILLLAGYPRESVMVVLLDREPAEAFGSWLRCWGGLYERDALFRRFAVASLNAERVRVFCEENGIRCYTFPLHWARSPRYTMPLLFHNLGLDGLYRDDILHDWRIDSFADAGSKITFSEEPRAFQQLSIHGTTPYYFHRGGGTSQFTEEENRWLRSAGVYGQYHAGLERSATEIRQGSQPRTESNSRAWAEMEIHREGAAHAKKIHGQPRHRNADG